MTRTFLLISIVAAAFGLSACSTSPLSRIDQDRARYESWPLEIQEGILAGEARKGMTREQVEMALGRPTQIVSRSAREGDDEVWIYRKSTAGSNILRNTGVSIGGGVGGVNVGTGIGGGGRGQTPEESEVVFANGVVVRSDARR
jgi:outer membrane protein assembly factor BamE (lipoprotein component of BamABCDE complex)